MTRPPRYHLIGFEPEKWSDETFGQVIERYYADFVGVENYTSETKYYVRPQDVRLALQLVILRHLESPGLPDAGEWIRKGFDCALNYFLDDWEISDPPDHPEDELLNMIAAKRAGKADDLPWFETYSEGLLLGLLSGRRDDMARFCSWPWDGLKTGYYDLPVGMDAETALMYLVAASGLAPEPMAGIEGVKARARKGRAKGPRLLMRLWETVEAGDQAGFDKALRASMEHHASLPAPQISSKFEEQVALPQSTIANAGVWRGLRLPELPDELSVYLITHASLGLDA